VIIDKIGQDLHKKGTAVIYGRRRLDYPQLRRGVSSLSGFFSGCGIRRGDRVAFLADDGILFAAGFLAMAGSGCVVVPLNTRYKVAEITRYLEDCRIKHVVCDEGAARCYEAAFAKAGMRPVVINSRELRRSRGRETIPLGLKYSDEILRQFSSGSTERPKLVSRTYGNLLSEARGVSAALKLTSRDKILCLVPLYHAYGLGTGMTPSLLSGATLVLVEKFHPRKILDIIIKEKITIILGVPPMFRILSGSVNKKTRLRSLRYCFSAGIGLPADVSAAFKERFGIYVRDLYGTTETGCIAANLDRNIERMLSSVGRPIRGTKISVMLEDGRRARPGQTGEIVISTPTCGRWYVAADNKRPLLKNNYFYTADIGKLDKKKNLYIVGRRSAFINVAGEKVDSKEVEAVLRGYPSVKEAVVLSVPDVLRGEAVRAVVVTKDGVADKAGLLKHCRQRLADFKVPRVLEFRESIPRSALGKVLKGFL